jgi:hypothetical protein
MERGERIGALKPGIDREVGLAMLLGPMIYRHVFVKRMGKPSPRDLEMQVADGFLALFGTGKTVIKNDPHIKEKT